jgi:hypothetical protein
MQKKKKKSKNAARNTHSPYMLHKNHTKTNPTIAINPMDIEALLACFSAVVGLATVREIHALVGFLSHSAAGTYDRMEIDASGWDATAKPIPAYTCTDDRMDIDDYNPPYKRGGRKRRKY